MSRLATYRLKNKHTGEEMTVNKSDYHSNLSNYADWTRVGDTRGEGDAPIELNGEADNDNTGDGEPNPAPDPNPKPGPAPGTAPSESDIGGEGEGGEGETTEDEFTNLGVEALKDYLANNEVNYHANSGEKKLRELCRETAAAKTAPQE